MNCGESARPGSPWFGGHPDGERAQCPCLAPPTAWDPQSCLLQFLYGQPVVWRLLCSDPGLNPAWPACPLTSGGFEQNAMTREELMGLNSAGPSGWLWSRRSCVIPAAFFTQNCVVSQPLQLGQPGKWDVLCAVFEGSSAQATVPGCPRSGAWRGLCAHFRRLQNRLYSVLTLSQTQMSEEGDPHRPP